MPGNARDHATIGLLVIVVAASAIDIWSDLGHGAPLAHQRPQRIAQRLGILLQETADPFPATVLETALIGRHPHLGTWQWEGAEDRAAARAALAEVELDPGRLKRQRRKLPYGGRPARCQDVVAGRLGPEHPVHPLDVVAGVAPVALGVEVAEVGLVLQAGLDAGGGAGDLPRHERLAAAGTFMVEENSVRGVHVVRLPVVHRNPVGIQLGTGVGAARVERRRLRLRSLLHLAVELGSGRLVETNGVRHIQNAGGLQQAESAEGVDVGGVLGGIERHLHVALRREIVDLVGLRFLHDPDEIGGVRHVSIVEKEMDVLLVRVFVEVVDPVGVKLTRPALNAVDLVPLVEQKFGKVRAILPRDARDEGDGTAVPVLGDFARELFLGAHKV